MSDPGVVFRVLGQLDAPGIDRVRPQARALLAYLLLHPNTRHTISTLAEVLPPSRSAGERGPRDPKSVVEAHISTIRKLVGGYATIPRTGEGFLLRIEEELIDRTLFDRLVGQARAAKARGERRASRDLLLHAIELWRSDAALTELDKFPRVASDAATLTESLGSALTMRYELGLELQGTESVLPDLVRAARRHITHRPLVELAMRANCDCHRTRAAETLGESYIDACSDMGRQPDPELRSLLLRIRDNEPGVGLQLLAFRPVRGPGGAGRAAWDFPEDLDDRLAGRVGPHATLDARLRYPERGDAVADTPEVVLAGLRDWAESETLLTLLDNWDTDDPLPRPEGEGYLERFRELELASEAWNYRNYTFERWEQKLANLGDGYRQQVIDAAEALGMREATVPAHERYELAIALGGARRSPLCRTMWLDLLTTRCEIRAVAFAASLRPIDEEMERRYTVYAEKAETEFDLMHAAVERARRLRGGVQGWDDTFETAEDGNWWASSLARTYETPAGGRPLFGFAGASEAPKVHRPRTPDTLRFLRRKLDDTDVDLGPGARVLLVTSPIYVPYQQIEALRVLGLPHDLAVETVAHPRECTAAGTKDEMENLQRVGNYLQEMRSAIEACRRLAEDVVA